MNLAFPNFLQRIITYILIRIFFITRQLKSMTMTVSFYYQSIILYRECFMSSFFKKLASILKEIAILLSFLVEVCNQLVTILLLDCMHFEKVYNLLRKPLTAKRTTPRARSL